METQGVKKRAAYFSEAELRVADGHIVLTDPPATAQPATVDEDEEVTSAVTEVETEDAGRPTEIMAGDSYTEEGPSNSTQNLGSVRNCLQLS
ncbi:hypothetical protein PGIGA_G00082280 [Pangasianodon gigas]|uniref:Uncharacterized protein n=1 Tax=Pangasianodon gigas TaxID=30993 RepID=A0ACC5XAL0_PANGG|nr:hypothetical protein [Pangasianodon gigas]